MKEKECLELVHKENALKSNVSNPFLVNVQVLTNDGQLEKAEKLAHGFQEKALKVGTIQRKLDDVEKLHDKTKTVSDKKLVNENEMLNMQLRALRAELDSLQSNKENYTATVSQLTLDKKELKKRVHELAQELKRKMEENEAQTSELRQQLKEVNSKLARQQTTVESQKSSLEEQLKIAQESLREANESFETQRVAYLGRINQLESDLEASHQTAQKGQTDLEKAVKEIQKLDGKKHQYQEDLNNLREAFEDSAQEKDSEIQRLKQLLEEMTQTLSETQVRYNKASSDYSSLKKKSIRQLEELQAQAQQTHSKFSTKNKDLAAKLRSTEENLGKELKRSHKLKTQVQHLEKELKGNSEHSVEEIQMLKASVIRLETSLATTTEALDRKSRSLETLQQDFTELQEKSEQKGHELMREISEQSTKNTDACEENKRLISSITSLEHALSCANANLDKEQALISQLRSTSEARIAELESKLMDLHENYTNQDHCLQSVLQDERNKVIQLREELDQKDNIIMQLEEEKEKRLGQWKDEKDQLVAKVSDSSTTIHELQLEIQQLSAKTSEEHSTFSRAETRLKAENKLLQGQIMQYHEKLGRIESDLESSRQISAEQNTSLQHQEDLLAEKQEDINKLTNSISELSSEISLKQNVICDLGAQLARANEDTEARMDELSELQFCLKECQTELLTTTDSLLIEKQNASGLASELYEAKRNLESFRCSLTSTERSSQETQSALQESHRKISEMTKQVQELQVSVLESKQALQEAEKSHAEKTQEMENGLESAREQAQMEVQELNIQLTAARTSLSSAESLIEEHSAGIQGLRQIVENKEQELIAAEKSNTERQQEIENLKHQIEASGEDAQKCIRRLQEDLKKTQDVLEAAKKDSESQTLILAGLESQLKDKENEIILLTESSGQKDAEIENLQRQAESSSQQAKAEIRNLSEKLIEAQMSFDATSNEYNELSSKLEEVTLDLAEKEQELDFFVEADAQKSQEIESLQKQLGLTSDQAQEELQRISKDLSESQARVNSLGDIIQAQKLEIQKLLASASDLERAKDHLILQKTQVENQIEQLLLETSREQAKLNSRVFELESQKKELSLALGTAKSDLVSITTQNKQQQAQLAELDSHLTESLKIVAGKESVVSALNAKLLDLEATVSSLQDQLCGSEQQALDQSGMVQELTSALNVAQGNIETYEENMKAKIAETQSLMQENETLKVSEACLQEQTRSLSVKLAHSETDFKNSVTTYLNQVKELEAELKAKELELHAKLAKARDESDRIESQLRADGEALSSQMVASKERIFELEADLRVLGNREKEVAKAATQQIALVEEQVTSKVKTLESESKDLVTRLQLQIDLAEQYETQLNDVKSRLSVAELRLMNEVSARDLQVRALEDRVRSKTSEFETFQKATLEQKRSVSKSKDESKHLQSELEKTREDVKRYKEFEKMGILERQSLQSRLMESEKDISKLTLEMER